MTDTTHELTPAVHSALDELLSAGRVTGNRDLVRRILETGIALGSDGTDRLNLKMTAGAVAEMRQAFLLYAPYADIPKVTIFGSARTRDTDPLYVAAHDVAAKLAEAGWMVVTGAGPGIMQAAAEGAGKDMAIGISIRLPFEEKPSAFFTDAEHIVAMKYFFTRKLMLMKESSGFVCVPGGFGTMDEMFELLTLQQTGKAEPAPIVLLDAPGGTFWQGLKRFVDDEMVPSGVISADDLDRVLITDSVEEAEAEITGFWRNYDSLRWVGEQLVLRLRTEPTSEEIDDLNERFADLLASSSIRVRAPFASEIADDDVVDLPRLVLHADPFKVGQLYHLIRAINDLPSAPDRVRAGTNNPDAG